MIVLPSTFSFTLPSPITEGTRTGHGQRKTISPSPLVQIFTVFVYKPTRRDFTPCIRMRLSSFHDTRRRSECTTRCGDCSYKTSINCKNTTRASVQDNPSPSAKSILAFHSRFCTRQPQPNRKSRLRNGVPISRHRPFHSRDSTSGTGPRDRQADNRSSA